MSPRKLITVQAPAKVNLYVHVTGRRSDGYHELDSLIVFTELHDEITVTPHDCLTLQENGPFGHHLRRDPSENIVLQAAKMLATLAGLKAEAKINLYKALPIAAGLGGGSADAAATLRALCRLWLIDPKKGELDALALSLGADVPVCLHGLAAHVGGIGEVLKPLSQPLPQIPLLLVNPGVPLPTQSVYDLLRKPFTPSQPLNVLTKDTNELSRSLAKRSNDLLQPAKKLCPAIDDVLEVLTASDGCKLARLSGSGPTCFGLFADKQVADAAASRISALRGDWWVKSTHCVGDIRTLDYGNV